MSVGAISGIGSVSFSPYVYNTNMVSSASLNPIKAIPDDPRAGGVYLNREVETEPRQENINPLRPGESSSFADILMSQMSMGAIRQANLFAAPEVTQSAVDTSAASETAQDINPFKMNQAAMAYSTLDLFA